MKRFFAGAAAFLLAAALCCSAFAAEYGYYVKEADASIALPSWEDYYYLYPGMAADSEDLIYLEMTSEEVDNILIPNGILFDALYYDASHEIAVQVIDDGDGEVLDYSRLRGTERDEVAQAVCAELEQTGCAVQTVEWLDGENAVWLVTELSLPEGDWVYQIHTYFGSSALAFTASTATGAELTDEIRQVTANMALGTVFQSYRPASAEEDESPDLEELLDQLPLQSILTGALIGFGAGVVVVAVIVVVIARKGRGNKSKSDAAEGEKQ